MTRFFVLLWNDVFFLYFQDPYLWIDPMMFGAQTTAKRKQAIKKKSLACEHDQHLNATDGTVRCSECSTHRSVIVDALCQLLPFALYYLPIWIRMYCARLTTYTRSQQKPKQYTHMYTHTHTRTQLTVVCLLLIWRTKNAFEIHYWQ